MSSEQQDDNTDGSNSPQRDRRVQLIRKINRFARAARWPMAGLTVLMLGVLMAVDGDADRLAERERLLAEEHKKLFGPEAREERWKETFDYIVEWGRNDITGVVNWMPLIDTIEDGDGVGRPVTFRFEGHWPSCMAVYRAFTESMRHDKATANAGYLQRLNRHSAEIACGSGRGVNDEQASIRLIKDSVIPPGAVVVAPEYRVPSTISPASR